ncbi:hypothetical protein GYA13_00555 [Candidatus Kuenenbacteria bacterium]|nr:hypothetical protein [Candidatus Kuenenbacteria bacterium]
MEKQIKYVEFFETKDQYIASLLFSMGMKFENTRREGNVVFFVFDNKPKCEEIEKLFYQGKLKIDPKKYIDGLITIKHLIFGK